MIPKQRIKEYALKLRERRTSLAYKQVKKGHEEYKLDGAMEAIHQIVLELEKMLKE